jgi:hypothetical protein
MPIAIYQKTLTAIVPQIDFSPKVLEDIFSPLVNSKAFLDLGKIHAKTNSYAILLEPTDPSGLFIGKMTDSCMHVEGDAEKTAIIPGYASKYAGFIAIQVGKGCDEGSRITKSKVKAGCYVWITKDGDIVLDSFEYKKEGKKDFVPFITKLATYLDSKGLKLFIGKGGKTPEIFENNLPLTPEARPEARDAETAKCMDSTNVYLIKPGVKYIISNTGEADESLKLELNTFEEVQKFAIFKNIYLVLQL